MRIVKTAPEFVFTKREAEVVLNVLGVLPEGTLRNLGLSQEDRQIANGIFEDIEDVVINSRKVPKHSPNHPR